MYHSRLDNAVSLAVNCIEVIAASVRTPHCWPRYTLGNTCPLAARPFSLSSRSPPR